MERSTVQLKRLKCLRHRLVGVDLLVSADRLLSKNVAVGIGVSLFRGSKVDTIESNLKNDKIS